MDKERRMKIDTYFKELEEEKKFSGGILVAQGDNNMFKKNYGMANHDLNIKNQINSSYLIASITKSITAMAIMILNQQNKLDINDTLSKYIPDFLNGDRITILLKISYAVTKLTRHAVTQLLSLLSLKVLA
jgi:CubicO group peptidase (beta-lactamase class C family)